MTHNPMDIIMSYFLEKKSIKMKDQMKISSHIILIKRMVSFITIIYYFFLNQRSLH